MRMQVLFWLDTRKAVENDLFVWIVKLKAGRKFSQTVKNGLKLMKSLDNGDFSVLIALFPGIFEQILAEAIRLEIAKISPNLGQNGANLTSKPPKIDENEVILAVKPAKSDENPAFNMLLAGLATGSATVADLPPQVVAYGVKMGKIAPNWAEKGPKTSQKGPKKMAVPSFDAPNIDLDLAEI